MTANVQVRLLCFLCGFQLVTAIDSTTHFSNASASPPFGIMQPEPSNPVAVLPDALPPPFADDLVTPNPARIRRQFAGLEVAVKDDIFDTFPSSQIMATWTFTPQPTVLPSLPTIADIFSRGRREMKFNDRQADHQPVSTSSSVFDDNTYDENKSAGEGGLTVGALRTFGGGAIVQVKRSDEGVTRRPTTTSVKRTTEDDGWNENRLGSEQGGMGLAVPGNILGV
ncbi:hypothetical protein BV898_07379 [Hypsibius exemplaris]|uniref:Amidase domain-containing protein n=1 Tax=Hypsibius exemplaris TaxID=2072580 RepID=A0A1W0WTT4_HYPEX|nr:hypothetical protein BV898_07379 [Hypsibius exemplaris]